MSDTAPRDLAAGVLIALLPLTAALGPIAGVGPIFAFRLVVVALAILALLTPRRWSRADTAFVALGGLFLLAAAGSAALSPFDKDWRELVAVGLGLALMWSLSRLGPANLVWWCRGWVPGFALCGAVAVWEIITGHHLSGYRGGAWRSRPDVFTEPGATFINPNLFAVFLVGCLGFAVVGALVDQRWRWVHALVAVLTLPLLVATGSRLALLAVIVGLIIVGLCVRRTRWLTIGLAAIGVVVLAGVAVGPCREFADEVGFQIKRVLVDHRLGGHNTLASRLALSVNAADAAWTYPLTGVGPGAFDDYLRHDPLIWTYRLHSAHNGLGEIAAQYGLVVLTAVVALLIAALVAGSRAVPRPLGIAVVVGVVTFPIVALCNSTFLEPSATQLIPASLALLVAATREHE